MLGFVGFGSGELTISDNSLGSESSLGACKSCARNRLNTSAQEGELLPSGTLKVNFDWRDTSDGDEGENAPR